MILMIVTSEWHGRPLPPAGELQGESPHVPHPPQEGRYHYDEEEDEDRNDYHDTITDGGAALQYSFARPI